MRQRKENYILESREETERLNRQSQMKAYDFRDELQRLPIQAGQKILDAGCGSGIVSDYLSKRAPGVTVTGWDFSKDRITEAKARYGSSKNITFAQQNLVEPGADFSAEQLNGGRFDVIVCRYVLRHFTSKDGQKVMQNLWKALKPGGILCCIDIEGVLGDVFPASPFLKKALTKLRESKAVDFQIARKLPGLLLEQGFQNVTWQGMLSEFVGTELQQEADNLEQAVGNAEAFAKKTLGGEAAFARFKKEYFTLLREQPGLVLHYNRVIAMGTKPSTKPKLLS